MKLRYFIGYYPGGERILFRSAVQPTRETHGAFEAVVGPFRTKRGAQFMYDMGVNNPHCQTVAQAEKLAALKTA